MNKTLLFISLGLLLTGCRSGAKDFPWQTGDFQEVLGRAGEKLVMLEFYTDW
jgi:hypothetical protein